MIKLTRAASPIELTPQVVQQLTADYLADKNERVWNKKYIRDGLMAFSFSKCAFCETKVDEEAKYMEVDHFRCKRNYPTEVVLWGNLLPTCKRCNIEKGDHDVLVDGPILNPTLDDPAAHLFFYNYRLYGRDALGESTIETLYLNDTDRLVGVRYSIGEAISSSLDELKIKLDACVVDPTPRKWRNISRGFLKLLREGMPPSEYSATAATSLVRHPYFLILKDAIRAENLWAVEFDQVEAMILQSALT